jgi:hypothetical protein
MPKRIVQDGREYSFEPGKNGSLTSKSQNRIEPPAPSDKSKTVPSPLVDEERASKRIARNIANTMMTGKLGYR